MAEKSTDSVLDDQEIPDREEQQEQEQPRTLRGSIKAAFDEHRDDDDTNKSDIRKSRVHVEAEVDDSDDTAKHVADNKESGDKAQKSRVKKEETDDEQVSSKEGEKKEEIKIYPPPFFKIKGKATWEKLSPEDKNVIVAREKEVSDGFAQISQRLKATEDIERVIAPRLQTIQQYGVPPAQVVDRLFQWMENLQNPQTAAQAFKDLAQGLGVNLNQLTGQVNTQQAEENRTDAPPPWFSEFTGVVDQRLSKVDQIEQRLENQQKIAAANAVSNWAKDKPHYQQVAPLMGQLLSAGIVGLKEDGSVDLDGAYEKAIKLDPNVAALIQQEAADKQAKEASEKATKEAKERAEKLTRAKRAGVGLKPAAPSGPAISSNKGLNGKKDSSVRGSIKAALEEISENA